MGSWLLAAPHPSRINVLAHLRVWSVAIPFLAILEVPGGRPISALHKLGELTRDTVQILSAIRGFCWPARLDCRPVEWPRTFVDEIISRLWTSEDVREGWCKHGEISALEYEASAGCAIRHRAITARNSRPSQTCAESCSQGQPRFLGAVLSALSV